MRSSGLSTLPVAPLKVAIASGKGGTGKTTVATNLAWLAAQCGWPAAYLDCDTEAPNGHLFLRPVIDERHEVVRLVPQIDAASCSHCGECGKFCQFNALICLGDKVLSFPELCHGCGGCALVCPAHAISEKPRTVGTVETGMAGPLRVAQGTLQVGEASSPPVIRAVKQAAPQDGLCVFDAPPGTACPMMETIHGAHYVLLVTEATPFGLHDLQLAVHAINLLKIPAGVVINRASPGVHEINDFCQRVGLPVWAEIPDLPAIAQAYSQGELIVEAVPELRPLFAGLLIRLAETMTTSLSPHVHARLEAMAASMNGAVQPSGFGDKPACFHDHRVSPQTTF
jgi:MinD superfamily P-loop ATPase